jgi:elongation factor G
VTVPSEYQGAIIGDLNRRRGTVQGSEGSEGDDTVISAAVPLSEMFGYSTALRSMTQGKGEFTMEYAAHAPVTQDALATMTAHFRAQRAGAAK